MHDNEDHGGKQMTALETILIALEATDVDPSEPVEILIRVRGKEDRTLKISLEDTRELREILKITTGLN